MPHYANFSISLFWLTSLVICVFKQILIEIAPPQLPVDKGTPPVRSNAATEDTLMDCLRPPSNKNHIAITYDISNASSI